MQKLVVVVPLVRIIFLELVCVGVVQVHYTHVERHLDMA